MTEPPPATRRRERGFTLLEIMVALAILAVGAICVMSTFAAALALQLRRDAAVRTARVLEEATAEAQAEFDAFTPTKERLLPAPIPERPWSRNDAIGWSVTFAPAPGFDARVAVKARVIVVEHGSRGNKKEREQVVFLDRTGFPKDELATSLSFQQEKKDAAKAATTERRGR